MYNLGLILKDEGKYADAVDTLYRAAWDYEYASAAYYSSRRFRSCVEMLPKLFMKQKWQWHTTE